MINSSRRWRRVLRPRTFAPYLLLALLFPHAGPAEASSVSYGKHYVHHVVAHVVTINLNDPDVRLTPVFARRGVGTSERFESILNRTRPTAAITGTFFDTRSLYPTGDIVVDGEMVCRGVVGTAIGIGWNNEVDFIPTRRGAVSDWSAYHSVLCAGPRLLADGKPVVYPKGEGFRDRSIYSKGIRAAVGVTRWNKLLLVTTRQPVYLSRLAKVMRALGARDAATLDGGSSTALYYRGRFFARPDRKLTNLLVVYDSLSGYEQARQHLAPGRSRRKV
ncbi:MAG: phosphodiester glycosidase family protein [Armatimonadota bacterium]|nr:phosphodiester glycosidase family protein [Armatimonadota bacterium]